jgi:hypothetical protein
VSLTWSRDEFGEYATTGTGELTWAIVRSGDEFEVLHTGTEHPVATTSSVELARDLAEKMESQKEAA